MKLKQTLCLFSFAAHNDNLLFFGTQSNLAYVLDYTYYTQKIRIFWYNYGLKQKEVVNLCIALSLLR